MKRDFLCEISLEENDTNSSGKEFKVNLVRVELVIAKDTENGEAKVVKTETHFGSI